jgi:hypothetical protein
MNFKDKSHNRSRKNTGEEQNQAIDEDIIASVHHYKHASYGEITHRLDELKKEWDIEKTLQVNASSLILFGTTLGTLVNKKWYILPGIVSTFLLQHGLQGWCPPLPIFRMLGYRTRPEIDEERNALKILRGDFEKNSSSSDPQDILKSLRK